MTFSILTLNYNAVEAMARLFSGFLVALLFSVHCLQRRPTWYTRLYKEMTNASLTVLYGQVASPVHCAGLCSGDDYCMEFLYSEISRQCLAINHLLSFQKIPIVALVSVDAIAYN